MATPSPRDVRSAASARPKQRYAIIQRGRGKHTERSGNLSRLIGQDVAEHVLRHHDVKVCRSTDELHGGVVDEQVLKLHVGVLLVLHAMHDLAPHAARLQHVALINARHLAATFARRLKCLARNAFNLVLAILHHVDRTLTGRTRSARAGHGCGRQSPTACCSPSYRGCSRPWHRPLRPPR